MIVQNISEEGRTDMTFSCPVDQVKRAEKAMTEAKERGEISYSNIKPYRQKGTGRARAGTWRSPLWVGGGIIHGPSPRDYSYVLPKKTKRLALRSALSDRAANGRVIAVQAPDDFMARLREGRSG